MIQPFLEKCTLESFFIVITVLLSLQFIQWMYLYNRIVSYLVLFQVGSRQQQNTSSARKIKQQNYSSPVAKVFGSAPSKVTSPPAEFQALWTQLQVSIMI
jgi:hypothetical protein